MFQQQHSQSTDVLGRAGRRCGFCLLQVDSETEAAAFSGRTAHCNLPLHQFAQAAHNRQPEPGAAVAAGSGGIDLAEGFEQPFARFRRDADPGVAHLAVQFPAVAGFGQRQADGDFPAAGKFDGVADQVGENLAQAAGITDHVTHRHVAGVENQFQMFGLGQLGHIFCQFPGHLRQVERNRLELQFIGFNFGEIKDVVDQSQQGVSAAGCQINTVALLTVEWCGAQQIEHTDDTVHRRADLMAHAGEKFAFGADGAFSLGFGFTQGDLIFFLARDVAVAPYPATYLTADQHRQ